MSDTTVVALTIDKLISWLRGRQCQFDNMCKDIDPTGHFDDVEPARFGEAADEIDRLTATVKEYHREKQLVLDTAKGMDDFRAKADALAEAVRELQKQGRHENGPEPDGNGAYVVSDIDWQEFEAALTAYKEGDS